MPDVVLGISTDWKVQGDIFSRALVVHDVMGLAEFVERLTTT